MSASFKCDQSIRDCVCDPDPVSNFSSEDPDGPVFIANVNVKGDPPLNQYYDRLGCLGTCESTVSQEEADNCALLQAERCVWDSWPQPGFPPNSSPRQIYSSQAQTCHRTCSDGSQVTISLEAGSVISVSSQADADARAVGLCKQQAEAEAVAACPCIITSDPLADAPASTFYATQLFANAALTGLHWSVLSGSLPPGLSLSTSGLISGTAGATLATYPFTVRLLADGGTVECQKDFSITVGGCAIVTAPTAYWKLDSWFPIGGGSSGTADIIAGNNLNDLNSSGPITLNAGPAKINDGVLSLPDHINFGDSGPLAPALDAAALTSFTVRLWIKTDAGFLDNLLAEHRAIWDLYGLNPEQKLQLRVGSPPLGPYDVLTSSIVWTPNVWHRVVLWRDLPGGVIGLALDDNSPDTTPILLGAGSNSQYLFFGPDTATVQPSYDEIGYWIGYVWTAADRECDWNFGMGRSWPI